VDQSRKNYFNSPSTTLPPRQRISVENFWRPKHHQDISVTMTDSSNGVDGTAGTNGTNRVNGTNGHSESSLPSVEQFLERSHDFVVVGGGTAGLAIAARLTENPDVTVGVIEAGKNRLGDMFVDTPALFLQMLGNPEYDWMMFTTPQVRASWEGYKASNNMDSGWQQRQGSSFPTGQTAWRIERHKLHDVSWQRRAASSGGVVLTV
jgi:GMC oxidoreductase